LNVEGAALAIRALSDHDLRDVEVALAGRARDVAGIRLAGLTAIASLLSADGAIGRLVASALGDQAFPVRAVLFDKSEGNNWNLGWHQDRTVVVRERRKIDGYGPWSVKAGLQHVAPPFRILAGMVTLRVHLDAVDNDNAPLLISPGSHRLGRLPEGDIPGVVARLGTSTCLAEAGDVWVYATPIVHASGVAARPRSRRVLQIDYAAHPLDGGLEWLGV